MNGIDELIRKAIEEGKFQDLPGEGKPLRLDENPLEDPGWRMAHHVLKTNGFTLPWIEQRQSIESDLTAARRQLQQAWLQHQKAGLTGEEWARALKAFEEQVTAINKQISSYNLAVPLDRFQKRLVQVKQEVDRLTTLPLSDTL